MFASTFPTPESTPSDCSRTAISHQSIAAQPPGRIGTLDASWCFLRTSCMWLTRVEEIWLRCGSLFTCLFVAVPQVDARTSLISPEPLLRVGLCGTQLAASVTNALRWTPYEKLERPRSCSHRAIQGSEGFGKFGNGARPGTMHTFDRRPLCCRRRSRSSRARCAN